MGLLACNDAPSAALRRRTQWKQSHVPTLLQPKVKSHGPQDQAFALADAVLPNKSDCIAQQGHARRTHPHAGASARLPALPCPPTWQLPLASTRGWAAGRCHASWSRAAAACKAEGGGGWARQVGGQLQQPSGRGPAAATTMAAELGVGRGACTWGRAGRGGRASLLPQAAAVLHVHSTGQCSNCMGQMIAPPLMICIAATSGRVPLLAALRSFTPHPHCCSPMTAQHLPRPAPLTRPRSARAPPCPRCHCAGPPGAAWAAAAALARAWPRRWRRAARWAGAPGAGGPGGRASSPAWHGPAGGAPPGGGGVSAARISPSSTTWTRCRSACDCRERCISVCDCSECKQWGAERGAGLHGSRSVHAALAAPLCCPRTASKPLNLLPEAGLTHH